MKVAGMLIASGICQVPWLGVPIIPIVGIACIGGVNNFCSSHFSRNWTDSNQITSQKIFNWATERNCMDFLKYWTLRDNPFGRKSGRRFYAGAPQREAIARLTCLVSSGMTSGILLSPSGCGSTTLMRHVARSSGFGDCAVEMLWTGGQQDSVAGVYAELSAAMRLEHSSAIASEQVASAMDVTTRQSVRTVWLIDGCNSITATVARSLLDANRSLSVVMGTTPEAANQLLISLGHCPLRIELSELDLDETAAYVRHALYMAGCSEPVFSDSAIVRLYEIGEGRLGIISSLAEFALMVGASNQVQQINPSLIEAVQEELVRAA